LPGRCLIAGRCLTAAGLPALRWPLPSRWPGWLIADGLSDRWLLPGCWPGWLVANGLSHRWSLSHRWLLADRSKTICLCRRLV